MGGILITPCDSGGGAGTITEIQGTASQVDVGNGFGPVVVLSTPQDIAPGSSPTFDTITVKRIILVGDSSGSITLAAASSGETYARNFPSTKGNNGEFLQTQGTDSDDLLWTPGGSGPSGNVITLYENFAHTQNVDSDPTVMYSYLSPTDTLLNDNEGILIKGGFTLSNAGVTTLTGSFNGVQIMNTEGSDFDGGSGDFSFFILLGREASDRVGGNTSYNFKNGSIISRANTFTASSQNWGQDNLITIIGQSAASNQIEGRGIVIYKVGMPV